MFMDIPVASLYSVTDTKLGTASQTHCFNDGNANSNCSTYCSKTQPLLKTRPMPMA